MKPRFFAKPARFRKWLETNHDKKKELWVGFYKVGSGLPSMTWPQSVDEALCFGWIDGLRKSIDETAYMIRFTPRNPNSTWSAVNIKKVAKLTKNGLMMPPGIAAFEKRRERNSKIYSFEQENAKLADEYVTAFKKSKKAWKYYRNAAPSYIKQTTWWVMSAKKEETRLRRLNILIEHSDRQEKIPQVSWKKKK
ncbi:MAG: bacteriocin-protection protein [Pyrinomonadaceae bacterium]|nr:bacteriocin-protection protein [Pyrinomonadaceae bacterium]